MKGTFNQGFMPDGGNSEITFNYSVCHCHFHIQRNEQHVSDRVYYDNNCLSCGNDDLLR